MVHELLLCTESFAEFRQLASLSGTAFRTKAAKAVKIKCHNAYARFIHHLYEFWVAVAQRSAGTTSSLTALELDAVLNSEAKKSLRNKSVGIRYANLPGKEAQAETLTEVLDVEFGRHFRLIRNRTAHASHRRACLAPGDITLAVFYARYHQAVQSLFETAKFTWTVRDVETYDWMEIESFDLVAASGSRGRHE
jgi:hypothetical protein